MSCERKQKETKIQEFMNRSVEHEMYDHSSNNWSRRYRNESLKEKLRSHTRKTFKYIYYGIQLYLEQPT